MAVHVDLSATIILSLSFKNGSQGIMKDCSLFLGNVELYIVPIDRKD